MALVLSTKFDLKIDVGKMRRESKRAARQGTTKGLRFIRTRARTAVLRRSNTGKPSAPGRPPKVHSTDPTANLKNIRWEYDADNDTGVVGPLRINSSRADFVRYQSTIPNILEFGGNYTTVEEFVDLGNRGGFWRRVDRRRRNSDRQKRTRTVRIQPRPFMSVAFEAELAAGTIEQGFGGTFGS